MPNTVQVLTELADLATDVNRARGAMGSGMAQEVIDEAIEERDSHLSEQAAQIAKFHELAGTLGKEAAAAAVRAISWVPLK